MTNVRVIRGPGEGDDPGFDHRAGVVAETVGAERLALQLVRVAPGVRSQAHAHPGHETAGYVLEGELVVWFGEGLVKHVTARPGDFVYIPAGEPHVLAAYTERDAVLLLARTDPDAQEPAETKPALDRLPHLLQPPSKLPPPRAPRRPV